MDTNLQQDRKKSVIGLGRQKPNRKTVSQLLLQRYIPHMIKLSEMKTKYDYVREALERVERLNRKKNKKKKKTNLSLFEKFNSGGYFIRLIKQERDEKL